MSTKKVVVEGKGMNLFKVSESSGWFYAYQVDPGFISDTLVSVGKSRSLSDALTLIKSFTGKNIKSMSDW
jgi:hypothetical protein